MLSILQDKFGYSSFRSYQEEIIINFLNGNDCFVSLATGGGKSLCFVMPALVANKLVIVISPLISLMTDQVIKLRGMGISAEMLSSETNVSESIIINQLKSGDIQVLYITPEKLEIWTKELGKFYKNIFDKTFSEKV